MAKRYTIQRESNRRPYDYDGDLLADLRAAVVDDEADAESASKVDALAVGDRCVIQWGFGFVEIARVA